MDRVHGELFDPSRKAGMSLTIDITGTTTMTLSWCPSGEFVMGRADDIAASDMTSPAHLVRLEDGFWMGQQQVTQRIWQAVMGVPYRQSEGDDDLLPIEGVSWDRAQQFCHTLTAILVEHSVLMGGQRVTLPSEAQWEYACRAGSRSRWYFGNDEAELDQHSWYRVNSMGHSHPPGLKRPNPWGLYDVYGNVAEWCLDNFGIFSSSEAVDPCVLTGDSELKLVRGGHYNQPATECTSTSRRPLLHSNPFSEETGLRIALVDRGQLL